MLVGQASATTETRHIRVFVNAVSEANRKKRIGNATRQPTTYVHDASMTSNHNFCVRVRASVSVLCASPIDAITFLQNAHCSLECVRALDDFAFAIISVFASSFNFLYWPNTVAVVAHCIHSG